MDTKTDGEAFDKILLAVEKEFQPSSELAHEYAERLTQEILTLRWIQEQEKALIAQSGASVYYASPRQLKTLLEHKKATLKNIQDYANELRKLRSYCATTSEDLAERLRQVPTG